MCTAAPTRPATAARSGAALATALATGLELVDPDTGVVASPAQTIAEVFDLSGATETPNTDSFSIVAGTSNAAGQLLITGYATGAGDPQELFFAPITAVKNLMAKSGTSIGDYDLIEANEAFASQALADGRGLGWDEARVNVHGGAIALGHPIGASGTRVLVTLLHALIDRDLRTGVATLCLGGGDAVALSVERVS